MKNLLRSRTWFLVTYNSDFSELLSSCVHWAWIYHDKDNVEPHYHILCVFKNARALNGIKTMIHGDQNTFGEIVKTTLKNCLDYMLHGETGDKHEYLPEELFCDNSDFWESLSDFSSDPSSDLISLIDDIISGLPLRELARRYGRDFVRNFRTYISFAHCVSRQESGCVYDYETFSEEAEFAKMRSDSSYPVSILHINKSM